MNRIGGGPALPVFTPSRVTERGLHGQPTLVQNVAAARGEYGTLITAVTVNASARTP